MTMLWEPIQLGPRVLRCSPWQDPQHSRFQKPELLVDPQTCDTAIIISLQQKLRLHVRIAWDPFDQIQMSSSQETPT